MKRKKIPGYGIIFGLCLFENVHSHDLKKLNPTEPQEIQFSASTFFNAQTPFVKLQNHVKDVLLRDISHSSKNDTFQQPEEIFLAYENINQEFDNLKNEYLQQYLALEFQEALLNNALQGMEIYKEKNSFNEMALKQNKDEQKSIQSLFTDRNFEILKLKEKVYHAENLLKSQYQELSANLEIEKGKNVDLQKNLIEIENQHQLHRLRMQALANELQAIRNSTSLNEEKLKTSQAGQEEFIEKLKFLQKENDRLNLELANLKDEFAHKELSLLEQSRKDLDAAFIKINKNEKRETLLKQMDNQKVQFEQDKDRLRSDLLAIHSQELQKLKEEFAVKESAIQANNQHFNQMIAQNTALEATIHNIKHEKELLRQQIQDKSVLEQEIKANLEQISNELVTYKCAYEKTEDLLNETKEDLQASEQQKITLLATMKEELHLLKEELTNKNLELLEQSRQHHIATQEHHKQAEQEKQMLLQYIADLKHQAALEKDYPDQTP